MHPEFSHHLTALRRPHPGLVWLLVWLLGFAGIASASHVHLDGECCRHDHQYSQGAHCQRDGDNQPSLDGAEHQCSLCTLIELGQGALDTTSPGVATAAPCYQPRRLVVDPGRLSARQHRARAPPSVL